MSELVFYYCTVDLVFVRTGCFYLLVEMEDIFYFSSTFYTSTELLLSSGAVVEREIAEAGLLISETFFSISSVS
jgi:hypothetical protein